MPTRQGHTVPHQPDDPQVNSMDKGISEIAITTNFTATQDKTQAVYKGRWENFVGWCGKRVDNPSHMSLKHVLHFLQTQSERLAVNTIKGYVTLFLIGMRWSKAFHLAWTPCLRDGSRVSSILLMIMPAWCLELVLAALTKAPFEPIVTCPLKYMYLTCPTAFLLAITSTRRASEMYVMLQASLHKVFQCSCDDFYQSGVSSQGLHKG